LYLWLPGDRFSDVPRNYNFEGVTVALVPDLGPATKLLPTLDAEADPETLLVTVDDDVEYPPQLVDRLVRTSSLLPDCAIGFTGWSVGHKTGAGSELRHYNESVPSSGLLQSVQVIEGTRGVLYRRGHFASDVFGHAEALPAFRYHDDILLSGYLASRGIRRCVRWFNAASRQLPENWKIHCQETGLHTTDSWRELGWQCWSYWSDAFAAQPRGFGLTPKDRLQLGANVSPPQRGFTKHGVPSAIGLCTVEHDLRQLPWPWRDEQFREVLALDVFDSTVIPTADWLRECLRIVSPGGIVKLRLMMRPQLTPLADTAAGLHISAAHLCHALAKTPDDNRCDDDVLSICLRNVLASVEREADRCVVTLLKPHG